jgi:hypothetical protein
MAQQDGLVSRTYGSLVNGVSQQPAIIRLPEQGQAQQNMISKVVSGVSRRPPSEHISKLQATGKPAGSYFIHTIARDEDEQYIVIIEDGDLRVFDLDGNEADVTFTDGKGYLDFDAGSESAENLFSAVSVADYTFIVNKTVTVAMSGSPAASRKHEMFLYLKEGAGQYPLWTADFGGTSVSKQTGGGGSGELIDDLIHHLEPGGADPPTGLPLFTTANFANWDFTFFPQAVIYGEQSRNTGSPEDVEVENNWSESIQSFAIKKMQDFEDLPRKCADGYLIEITGSGGDEGDNYWVKYNADEDSWVETRKDGLDNAFNAATMPHTLVRTSISPLEFTFERATWDERLKGDEETAGQPTFVGNTVSDVVFHKNRFCILSDENIVLSEAGSFFNFWPSTVVTLVDSDPIDAASTNNRVALLDYAVPFDGALTLFSARGGIQNQLTGGDTLAAKNAEVTQVGAWSSSLKARPLNVGKVIYFLVDRDTATGVMEYNATDDLGADADDITSHVPTYIPGNVRLFAASITENMLALVSDDEPMSIFVYSFFFDQGSKVQASWSKWSFGDSDEIIGLSFIQSTLNLLVERDEDGIGGRSIHLEKIDLRTLTDGGFDYRIHLDSLIEATGVYAAGTDLTTWTLPYEQDSEGGEYLVIQSHASWGNSMGRAVPETDTSVDGVITVSGDLSAYSCHIGRVYEHEYVFTEAVISLAKGTEQSPDPITQGRLQVRRWKILFEDCGAFSAFVTPNEDSDEYEYPFSGVIVGASIIGPPTPQSGEHEFEVGGQSTHVTVRLSSSSFLPFTMVGAEWEGFYVGRSQRV